MKGEAVSSFLYHLHALALTSLEDGLQGEINPFLPKVILVMVFIITAVEML